MAWELAALALPPRLIYVVPVLVMDPPGNFPVLLRRKSLMSLIKIKIIKCNRPQKKPKDGG
jgi:hypothetical protein